MLPLNASPVVNGSGKGAAGLLPLPPADAAFFRSATWSRVVHVVPAPVVPAAERRVELGAACRCGAVLHAIRGAALPHRASEGATPLTAVSHRPDTR